MYFSLYINKIQENYFTCSNLHLLSSTPFTLVSATPILISFRISFKTVDIHLSAYPPPPSWIKAALNFPNLYPRKYSLCRLISKSGISGEDDCMFQLCSYVDHANGPNRHLRQVIFAQKRFLFTFVKILRLIFVWNWGETYAPKNQIFIQVCLLIQTTHAEDED